MDDNTRSDAAMPPETRVEELERRLQEALEEAKQAKERTTQAEERATQAEEKIRSTTFEEVLKACHELACLMTVETNKAKSTQGSTTSPKDKCCPTELKSWKEFPEIQQNLFAEFSDALHPVGGTSPELFNSRSFIEELGRTIVKRQRIGSEATLRVYHSVAVEVFVAEIVSKLVDYPRYGRGLGLGKGVSFENHTNTLSDLGEEVLARLPSLTSSKKYHPQNPTYADQICVSHDKADHEELLYIIEYKAPHKLTKETLRVGLRDMQLSAEVIQRQTIPTDPQEKFQYHADRFVAAATTQTYLYMLESGLEYSCIITGEAMVFLRIRKEEPNTLYYHLAEPKEEVQTGDTFQHSLTAVSQLLSFCLLSIRSTRRNQQWRDASIRGALTWTIDWKQILRGISEDDDMEAPPSAYKARTYKKLDRSPYNMRSRPTQPSSSGCDPNQKTLPDDRDDPNGDSDGGPENISTPSKRKEPRASATREGQRRRGTKDSSSAGNQHRQYCTHGCLLGLVQRSALDRSCPNARLHRRGKKGRTHLLNRQQFSDLVQRQLATDMDHNLKELKKQGIRGALFQIILESHGYVFVAKATCEVFVPDLQHEGRMYDRLQSLQGKMIPVYLGNIDLDRPWRDLHVRLTHMLLMSWAGERAAKVDDVKNLRVQIKQFEARIQRLGVVHNDLIPANILWNDQLQSLMFIDFEAATEVRREAVQELSNNRKRKQSVEKEEVTADSARRPRWELAIR